jgi:hypothetical protein
MFKGGENNDEFRKLGKRLLFNESRAGEHDGHFSDSYISRLNSSRCLAVETGK